MPVFYSLALFLTITSVSSAQTTDTFASGGTYTWTAPSCVTSATIEVWGAGGGGGAAGGAASRSGSGGGGGAYGSSVLSVIPGATYSLFVGAGGMGATSIATNGGVGLDSWFSLTGVTPISIATGVLAQGGQGGYSADSSGVVSGGQITFGFGTTAYDGAKGVGSFTVDGGGAGSSAGDTVHGNYGVLNVGGIAPSGGGNGGNGGNASGGNGFNGSAPGGGGGGGAKNNGRGADGADGMVKITYFSSSSSTYYWYGSISNDWSTPGNWCASSIPDSSIDVVIPYGTPNSPVIHTSPVSCKSITIDTGAILRDSVPSSILKVYGNWIQNGAFADPFFTTISFVGSSGNQTISGTPTYGGITSPNIVHLKIAVNKSGTSDSVILNAPLWIKHALTLTHGKIISSATNLLALLAEITTVTGGDTTSFVDGPMQRQGLHVAATYIFPIGTGRSNYAPIAISVVTNTAVTSFTCQYFNTSYPLVSTSDLSTVVTPTLTNVSKIEYWDVTRTSGTGRAAVTLYWQNASFSKINSCAADGHLKVAHYTSGLWENANSSGIVPVTGSCVGTGAGSVTSDTLSSFSPFTFGNDSLGVNPLPIELLSFDVAYTGGNVQLTWKTASEVNNNYFTIERSQDGIHYEIVGTIPSKALNGNSSKLLSYSMSDVTSTPGMYYYRLKQTDFDDKYKYSRVAEINTAGNESTSFSIIPNPSDGRQLTVSFSALKNDTTVISIRDIIGNLIYTEQLMIEHNMSISFPINFREKLSAGVYIVMLIKNGDTPFYKRMIVD